MVSYDVSGTGIRIIKSGPGDEATSVVDDNAAETRSLNEFEPHRPIPLHHAYVLAFQPSVSILICEISSVPSYQSPARQHRRTASKRSPVKVGLPTVYIRKCY